MVAFCCYMVAAVVILKNHVNAISVRQTHEIADLFVWAHELQTVEKAALDNHPGVEREYHLKRIKIYQDLFSSIDELKGIKSSP